MISYYEPTRAKVNTNGDLVCPNCMANLLTPPGTSLKAKIGKCSRCGQEFRVTQKVANLGNRLANGEIDLENSD